MDAVDNLTDPDYAGGPLTAARFHFASMRVAACFLALLLPSFLPILAQDPANSLPLLRTARQAHTLSQADAAHGYPIHLDRAQVTFYDPVLPALFVIDSTDGIFADLRGQPPAQLRVGDIVAVDAVSGPGKVAPVLLQTRLRIVGHAPLPAAPLVSFDQVLTGGFDARWITVEGIVRAVHRPGSVTAYGDEPAFGSANLILTLASGPDLLDVIALNPDARDHSSLVDAKVRLRANAGSRFNQRNQLIGIHLYMPDFFYVQIEESPPSDPFSLPVTDTAGVMRLNAARPGHRVHIHGVVTSTWGPRQFSLMDAEHGIFVHTDEPASVTAGQMLDVVGFPATGEYTSVLEDALYRPAGIVRPAAPVVLTAAQGLRGVHDAEPVQIDGTLLYKSRSPSEQYLVLTDNGTPFSAVLPISAPGFPPALQPGSRLRVKGICHIEVTPQKRPRDLRVLLQSPSDITVIEHPSWWTPVKALSLSVLLLAVIAVVVALNAGLRRRVRVQTRVIRAQLKEAQALRLQAEAAHKEKSESLANILTLQRDLISAQEKLRYQATHDGLTGLWNHGALLDLLHNEVERNLRTYSTMGVLMLDLDHFKLINDTHGHLVGDAVLQEIGHRISRTIRPYDTAGRYGGEEFLIILPSCDREQTESSAERIRTAISAAPFRVAGYEISLTVSIGATVTFDCGPSETEILSLADLALYQAKSAGRNCTVLRTSFQEEHAGTA